MSTLLSPQPPPVGSPSSRLDAFFERMISTNPFTDNRSNGPSASDVDVGPIHQAAFAQLTALAGEALAQRRGIGAVLWGEAGIGKSHLLSRLARWAQSADRACFVYLHNLQSSPANLARSLLKSVVSILTRGRVRRFYDTPLYHLALAAIREAVHHDTCRIHSWTAAQAALHSLVSREDSQDISRAALVERSVYDVLFHFFRSASLTRKGLDNGHHAGLAVRWLSGDYLDPDEARQLGLPPGQRDEPVALPDNQMVKQVLVALTQLALFRRQPFVLCFDQMDNLDVEQTAALARFFEALIDSSSNLLVVTAGIQATLMHWRQDKVIQDSAWDRLVQFEVALQRINQPEGSQIVSARLERFLEPFLEVEPLRRQLQEDHLFPLGRAWAADFFRDRIDLRPRDVINGAREGWRRQQELLRQQGGTAWLAGWERWPAPRGAELQLLTVEQIQGAIDRKVDQKMDEFRSQRQHDPATLPPDPENAAGIVHRLLEQCRQADVGYGLLTLDCFERTRSGRQPFDLLIRHRVRPGIPPLRTGVLFLATKSATATTADLRRIVNDPEPAERVLVVTDERQEVVFAAKGREYRAELRRRGPEGFKEVRLLFTDYAALDALQAVVWRARSGDLDIELPPGEARAVSEREVIESHHRQGRYRAAAVLREVFG